MLKPTIKSPQLGMFGSLADQLDQKHPLFLLAYNIEWAFLEDTFKVHYSSNIGPDISNSSEVYDSLKFVFFAGED